ncbi:MAG: EamA family transporter [Pseudomonadota bacterium]
MATREHPPAANPGLSTAIGFIAVLLWSLLALFTVGTAGVPPFQLTAMTFAIGGMLGLVAIALQPGPAGPAIRRALAQPWQVWALSVGGLFGYHYFYFTALKNAPPVEAGLIAYLWPLLIVLFAALLPGRRLTLLHLVGGLTGFAGAALLVLDPESAGDGLFDTQYAFGYGTALIGAVVWASYSVLLQRVGNAPTNSVAGFCLAGAALSAMAHLAGETTVWPETTIGWLSVLGLGLGPVGAAFYAWDYGCKRGDIQLLGVASYAAPLLSTAALVLAGIGVADWRLGVAALLITLGASLAAWGSARERRAQRSMTASPS